MKTKLLSPQHILEPQEHEQNNQYNTDDDDWTQTKHMA